MKARTLASILGIAVATAGIPLHAQAPATSTPAPAPLPARETRPNMLVWLMDDIGFAQLSAYGGLVDTPNIDRVAARGLKYSNFYSAPICSASRASLLTGRNPHSVHVGGHAGAPRPYPGYDGSIPAEAGSIAAYLRAGGYTTYALGKWDHLPTEEMTPSGPFNHWPSGQGFDRFYGFLAADTDNWYPSLISDMTPIPTPNSPGYHLNHDMADRAIEMINARVAKEPIRPFFMYWATGTAHSPHHAPKEWIDRYKGKFDMGWDKAREELLKRQKARGLVPASTKLAPRPDDMPAWDSLTADQKRLFARQMEVFAASVSYADEQFGRILDSLEKSGQLDNTVILITSDNGSSAEGAPDGTYNEDLFVNGHYPNVEENLAHIDQWGGPGTFPHYSMGWAVAGNTPFRYYKQTTYEGGMHVPMIVSWPKGIAAQGETRNQFVHISDIAPTLLDMAGVKPAPVMDNVQQMPLEGESFTYTFKDKKAADRKQAQYFEMYGNKGLWSDGWTIVTRHRVKTWDMTDATPPNEAWELYNVRKDPGQTTNLASKYPEKVAALSKMFEDQAARYKVNPVGNLGEAMGVLAQRARVQYQLREGKWVYPGPISHVSSMAGPPVNARPFRMSADLNLPTGGETGPIFALGGDLGGMGLFLKAGVPTFVLRGLDGSQSLVTASAPLPSGTNKVEVDFIRQPTNQMMVPQDCEIVIRANGSVLASQTVKYAMPRMYGVAQTFDIGTDSGSTLTDAYASSAVFPGSISQVTFDFNKR